MFFFKTFRDKIIPSVVDALKLALDKICDEAFSIALIPDGWSQPSLLMDFMGIGAFIIKPNFEKRLIIIGMKDISTGHTAEQTKEAIESVINKYKFDKQKIRGKILRLLSNSNTPFSLFLLNTILLVSVFSELVKP